MNKTPKLRFKEFIGDWEVKKLGDLLEFKNGINASKEQYGYGRKFINVLDILNNNYITHENIIGKVDVDDSTFEKYSVGYGDVVFQRSSETREEVGTANVYLDKDYKATFGGFIIRGKKVGEYEPIFMNKLLKTSSARKEITTKSGGSTRYNVGQETLSDVEVMFPKLEEQVKIASFFSLIDDKISLQGDKVEALKEYKKGMIQKIFRGELRFKDDDGRYYPEWRNIRLSEVLKERKSYSQKNEGLEHATLSKDGIYGKGKRYNRDFLVVTDDKKYKITKLGDICYNPANLKFGVICRNDYGDSIFSPIYVTFEVKSEADSEYMGAYLSRWDFINRVRKYEEGTVYERMAVKPEDFLRFEINLPSIGEQKKIKGFLNKIDEKVKFEKEKLNRLNEYKKGLLQQMFV